MDETKGYYNDERKHYMKHDTSMDYLREILENYRVPLISGKNNVDFIKLLDVDYASDKVQWRTVKKILYEIERFKKTSYYIWSGYSEGSDQFLLYKKEEDQLIESINRYEMNDSTMYVLLNRLKNSEYSDFVFRIMFCIGNEHAFNLIKKSKHSIALLEEDFNGQIELYSKKFKKSQK